jgi:hypothetical protein
MRHRDDILGGNCAPLSHKKHHHETMRNTMLAAVLHGIKDLRVDESAIPELEPGKALVKVQIDLT